jgi:3',5'-cyclic AMP phosphodiesterase CpdA
MFVSVDGKAKEVKEIFAGGTDGLAHKVDEVFGSVDGVATLVYSSVAHEPNAFDKFTWAEIKELADGGLLLDYFNRGDLVDIKFKDILRNKVMGNGEVHEVVQDGMTMQVSEVTATGMTLVAYTAVPFYYVAHITNQDYAKDRGETVTPGKTGDFEPEEYWGMCAGLYDGCKAIDNVLPDDMREVLHDYNPCYVWEYYIDDEGKKRFRKTYDDCRVHQVTTRGYKWHKEFVEENNREEYILDYSHYPRSESKFKKYFPEEIRNRKEWDYVSCNLRWKYKRYPEYNGGTGYWIYQLLTTDPIHSWTWDWENYDNRNDLYAGYYTTTSSGQYAVVPQVQIGVMEQV